MVVSEWMDGWAEAGTISRMQQKSLGVVDTTDDSKCAPHSPKAKSGKKGDTHSFVLSDVNIFAKSICFHRFDLKQQSKYNNLI